MDGKGRERERERWRERGREGGREGGRGCWGEVQEAQTITLSHSTADLHIHVSHASGR